MNKVELLLQLKLWNRFEDWLNITQNLSDDEVDDKCQYYVLIAIKKNKENYGLNCIRDQCILRGS